MKSKGLYINISNYQPLLGGSYISLQKALNNSMKVLINLKNKNRKCFTWCHVGLINPQNRNVEIIILSCLYKIKKNYC